MRCDRDAASLIAIALLFTVYICVANLQLQLQQGGIISRSRSRSRCRRRQLATKVIAPRWGNLLTEPHCNKLTKVMMRKVARMAQHNNTTTQQHNTIAEPATHWKVNTTVRKLVLAVLRHWLLVWWLGCSHVTFSVTAARLPPTFWHFVFGQLKSNFINFIKFCATFWHWWQFNCYPQNKHLPPTGQLLSINQSSLGLGIVLWYHHLLDYWCLLIRATSHSA